MRSATLALASGVLAAQAYDVKVLERASQPSIAYINGTTAFQQVYNPSWVQASSGTGGKQGLIIR